MINEQISIEIPTYKDAFILRKALIELGYKQLGLIDIKIWKTVWEQYEEKTICHINGSKLTIGCSDSFFQYKTCLLKDFIKKFILNK